MQIPRSEINEPGYWAECTQGEDETGTYFKVRGDFTG